MTFLLLLLFIIITVCDDNDREISEYMSSLSSGKGLYNIPKEV